MNTSKNFISNDNQLFKARVNAAGQEQIKVKGKWVELTIKGRYIKTKTLCVTKINHKSSVQKFFKEGKRYQVQMHAGLGCSAGYIYDEEGAGWQLYRSDDVGFETVCGTYRFEAAYK